MDVHSKIAVLTAVLGGFDVLADPIKQDTPVTFHRWTDDNFPPITGLTPRLQYRIPKYFGWQMFPGFDYYLWLDGAWTLGQPDSVAWYLEQLGSSDIAFFAHPSRNTVKEEVDHIEDHLKRGKEYITSRYKNGLHKEQLAEMGRYNDTKLYASTTFIYKDSSKVRDFMWDWWAYQSRYFTCDQIALPWLLMKHGLEVAVLDEPIYKTKHLKEVSKH